MSLVALAYHPSDSDERGGHPPVVRRTSIAVRSASRGWRTGLNSQIRPRGIRTTPECIVSGEPVG
jgi:hypothetical protein